MKQSPILHLATLVTCLVIVSRMSGATIGPLPYHSIVDSPFDRSRLGEDFFVEDFSNGIEEIIRSASPDIQYLVYKLSTPGVYATRGFTFVRGPVLTVIGGFNNGFDGGPGVRISFEFELSELGWLPQLVGFETSNATSVTLTAYGPDHNVLESLFAPPAPLPESAGYFESRLLTQPNGRERFFGIVNPAGISRIDLFSPMIITFVDDFQYGRLIPESSSNYLIAIGSSIILSVRHRKRPRH